MCTSVSNQPGLCACLILVDMSGKHLSTTTLGSCLICLRSAGVKNDAEVDPDDDDHDEHLSERKATAYPTLTYNLQKSRE